MNQNEDAATERPDAPEDAHGVGASAVDADVSADDFHSDRRDAERYRYLRRHMEWRRSGELADDDSHSFVGCRFPYLANFSCASMLDYNIDKMIEGER